MEAGTAATELPAIFGCAIISANLLVHAGEGFGAAEEAAISRGSALFDFGLPKPDGLLATAFPALLSEYTASRTQSPRPKTGQKLRLAISEMLHLMR